MIRIKLLLIQDQVNTTSNSDSWLDTSLINKIIKQIQGLNSGKVKEAYACFAFTDGLYFYRILNNCLDELTFKEVRTTKRGRVESGFYAHIPITLLTKME